MSTVSSSLLPFDWAYSVRYPYGRSSAPPHPCVHVTWLHPGNAISPFDGAMLMVKKFGVALNSAIVIILQYWESPWLMSTLNELQPLSALNTSNGSAPLSKMSVCITFSDGFLRKVLELLF